MLRYCQREHLRLKGSKSPCSPGTPQPEVFPLQGQTDNGGHPCPHPTPTLFLRALLPRLGVRGPLQPLPKRRLWLGSVHRAASSSSPESRDRAEGACVHGAAPRGRTGQPARSPALALPRAGSRPRACACGSGRRCVMRRRASGGLQPRGTHTKGATKTWISVWKKPPAWLRTLCALPRPQSR